MPTGVVIVAGLVRQVTEGPVPLARLGRHVPIGDLDQAVGVADHLARMTAETAAHRRP